MSSKVEPLMTVADLDLLPDDGNRYELFEGELYASHAPGIPHQRVLAKLIKLISNYLDRHPVGELLPTLGVIFDDYNAAIPDGVLMTTEQLARLGTAQHIHEAPALAIEIVSPGQENARRDRVMKRQAYGKFGVQEYWIADPETRTLEIYRLSKSVLTLTATLTNMDELTSPLPPGFSCTPAQIFGK